MSTPASRPILVDIHTHVYTPSYLQLLRARKEPPQILPAVGSSGTSPEEKAGKVGRLVILPGGDEGRPIGPQYWDKEEKIKFMDSHGIDAAVISLANPWLDFLTLEHACLVAVRLNAELDEYCTLPVPHNNIGFESAISQRFLAFGVVPLVPITNDPSSSSEEYDEEERAEAVVQAVLDAIVHITELKHLRGVILGTRGLGRGLDDKRLTPIWEALDESGLAVFLHPHYGVTPAKGADSEFGEVDNGHVLPLALGFPFETAIAASRLILSGVLDRHSTLKVILAHAAGALPILSSRLASCIAHDPQVRNRLQDDFRAYLGRLYYDAVAYGPEELGFLERCIARAESYEGTEDSLPFIERVNERSEHTTSSLERAAKDSFPGTNRIMFGTDHPFFPPAAATDESGQPSKWRSVTENVAAIENVPGWSLQDRQAVFAQNAFDLFNFEN